jgi:hypothetical protein
VKRDKRNRMGQAYGLTVLTPILEDRVSALAAHLDTFGPEDASPLARVAGTHFARWVIIEDVVYEGGRQRRDALKASRLLFTSNFDGPLDAHLEALRTELGDDADAVWGHCAGYPGRADPPAFAAYFRNHQVESALFFGAYGDHTVAEVHANLARRTRLIEFAMAAQGLEPAELRARFQAEFMS